MHQFLVVGFLLVTLLACFMFLEHMQMRRYWRRACAGRLWRRRFPEASKAEIREFLRDFIAAFGFADKRLLRFAPDDRIMDVYRVLYPLQGSPDAMELEGFLIRLEDRYRVEIANNWRGDITLGELFAQLRGAGQAA